MAQVHLRRGQSSEHLQRDRDRILQQLLETNLKLRDYDQDRTNFFARSIHDVRVPLMAVQGYCGLLLAGELGSLDPEQTRVLERMQRSLTRLYKLVEAIMDFGAGPNWAGKLRLEPASIEACAQQAVYEILPFARRKKITLNIELEPPKGAVLFDSAKIEQVIVNLLDNACKFTPRGGTITIRGASTTGHRLGRLESMNATGGYCVDIIDTGEGIKPDHLEQIFDEYASYEDPMGRGGSGLGLAICRMIIQAHNGRIWADSGENGASFSFVLPLVRPIGAV